MRGDLVPAVPLATSHSSEAAPAQAPPSRSRAAVRAGRKAERTRDDLLGLLVADVEDYAIFVLDVEGNVSSWNAGAIIRRLALSQWCQEWKASRVRHLAPIPTDRHLRRGAQLLAGLILYGVTAAMLVLAGLGLDPWDVLHQGLSRTLGLGIGTWAILISLVVLLAWWPLRQRPGVGTVANAVLVGVVIDLILSVAHPPHALWHGSRSSSVA